MRWINSFFLKFDRERAKSPKTDQLFQTVALWEGYSVEEWRSKGARKLVGRFGTKRAMELLERDYCSAEIDWSEVDLVTGCTEASKQFSKRHPDLPERVVRSLEGRFAYSMK